MIVQFEEIEGSMDDQKNMDESVKDTKKGLFNKVYFRQSRIYCSLHTTRTRFWYQELKPSFNFFLTYVFGIFYGISVVYCFSMSFQ